MMGRDNQGSNVCYNGWADGLRLVISRDIALGSKEIFSMHDNKNNDCPLNDPETFANPVTAGLGCECPDISPTQLIIRQLKEVLGIDHPITSLRVEWDQGGMIYVTSTALINSEANLQD